MTLLDHLRRNGQPLRFLIAGGLNTVVGIGLYPALLWAIPYFRKHYMTALGISQVVCVIFAFTIYKLGVFRTRSNVIREFGAFASFYGVNYALNWALLPLLVERAGLPPAIAQLIFVVMLIVSSYFWHSRLTFKKKRELPR